MKILLIEPDRHLAETLTLALQQDEYEIRVATDAQSGLDALDTFGPELVILELQLGKHNGIEFLYEQHSHVDWKNVPVIIHTFNQNAKDPQFQKAWKELGVKHILYKPHTSLAQLKKVITSL